MTITDSDLLNKYTELCEKYADLANKLVDERARSAKLVECLEILAIELPPSSSDTLLETSMTAAAKKALFEYKSEDKP